MTKKEAILEIDRIIEDAILKLHQKQDALKKKKV